MVCCFFGHSNTSQEIRPYLVNEIRNLIETGEAVDFLVGNQGSFDYMVLSVLRELKETYPNITYSVCLAYLPKKEEYSTLKPEETVYLEGMETAPLRFAISRRNDLMLKESDIVICYVKHTFGGSGKMVDKAIKQKKKVINLAEK